MIVVSDTAPLRYHTEVARLQLETNFRVTDSVVRAAWENASARPER
jgi:hypothetical protein